MWNKLNLEDIKGFLPLTTRAEVERLLFRQAFGTYILSIKPVENSDAEIYRLSVRLRVTKEGSLSIGHVLIRKKDKSFILAIESLEAKGSFARYTCNDFAACLQEIKKHFNLSYDLIAYNSEQQDADLKYCEKVDRLLSTFGATEIYTASSNEAMKALHQKPDKITDAKADFGSFMFRVSGNQPLALVFVYFGKNEKDQREGRHIRFVILKNEKICGIAGKQVSDLPYLETEKIPDPLRNDRGELYREPIKLDCCNKIIDKPISLKAENEDKEQINECFCDNCNKESSFTPDYQLQNQCDLWRIENFDEEKVKEKNLFTIFESFEKFKEDILNKTDGKLIPYHYPGTSLYTLGVDDMKEPESVPKFLIKIYVIKDDEQEPLLKKSESDNCCPSSCTIS